MICHTQLWYAVYSAWSGQPLFERWSLASFNLLFTSVQPFALALFDRIAHSDTMMQHPTLYKLSQDRASFSVRVFWVWILQALFHSLVLYFLPMALFHGGGCALFARRGSYNIIISLIT